jgi:hypothetical protein
MFPGLPAPLTVVTLANDLRYLAASAIILLAWARPANAHEEGPLLSLVPVFLLASIATALVRWRSTSNNSIERSRLPLVVGISFVEVALWYALMDSLLAILTEGFGAQVLIGIGSLATLLGLDRVPLGGSRTLPRLYFATPAIALVLAIALLLLAPVFT